MKRLTFAIILLIGLSSCSTYYYSTISSNSNQGYQVYNGDFVNENDSVLVTYSFNGINAPIKISVFNKSDRPLYVNWEESSLIIDDEATSYFNGQSTFSGTTHELSVQVQEHPRSPVSYGESAGHFAGNINTPKNTSYIPPQTRISYNTLWLNPDHLLRIDKKYYSEETIDTRKGAIASAKVINFDNNNSPLIFRSFLSLYYKQAQPFYLNDYFYVSKIIKTSKSPNTLSERYVSRGDIFYLQDTDYTAAYIVGGAAVLGGVILIISEFATMDDHLEPFNK